MIVRSVCVLPWLWLRVDKLIPCISMFNIIAKRFLSSVPRLLKIICSIICYCRCYLSFNFVACFKWRGLSQDLALLSTISFNWIIRLFLLKWWNTIEKTLVPIRTIQTFKLIFQTLIISFNVINVLISRLNFLHQFFKSMINLDFWVYWVF